MYFSEILPALSELLFITMKIFSSQKIEHQILSVVSETEFFFPGKTWKNKIIFFYVLKTKNGEKKIFFLFTTFFGICFIVSGNYNSMLYTD